GGDLLDETEGQPVDDGEDVLLGGALNLVAAVDEHHEVEVVVPDSVDHPGPEAVTARGAAGKTHGLVPPSLDGGGIVVGAASIGSHPVTEPSVRPLVRLVHIDGDAQVRPGRAVPGSHPELAGGEPGLRPPGGCWRSNSCQSTNTGLVNVRRSELPMASQSIRSQNPAGTGS